MQGTRAVIVADRTSNQRFLGLSQRIRRPLLSLILAYLIVREPERQHPDQQTQRYKEDKHRNALLFPGGSMHE
jgi:hypothetical protein